MHGMREPGKYEYDELPLWVKVLNALVVLVLTTVLLLGYGILVWHVIVKLS